MSQIEQTYLAWYHQLPLSWTESRGLAGPDRFVLSVRGNGYSSGSSSSLHMIIISKLPIEPKYRMQKNTHGSFHAT